MLILAGFCGKFDVSCEECFVYLEALIGKLILSFSNDPFVSGKIVRQEERQIGREVYFKKVKPVFEMY